MRIARRVRRVEAAASERTEVAAMARWVADRHGVTVEHVFAEARRLRDEAWRQGVAPEVIVAWESGSSVAEVRTEAAQLAAEWGERSNDGRTGEAGGAAGGRRGAARGT
jgi:hypothetical protein